MMSSRHAAMGIQQQQQLCTKGATSGTARVLRASHALRPAVRRTAQRVVAFREGEQQDATSSKTNPVSVSACLLWRVLCASWQQAATGVHHQLLL